LERYRANEILLTQQKEQACQYTCSTYVVVHTTRWMDGWMDGRHVSRTTFDLL